jgi:photosystem II stability/assembly factor-like uncharacterized protein
MIQRIRFSAGLLAIIALCQLPALSAQAATPIGGIGASVRVTPQGNVTQLVVEPQNDRYVYTGTASNGVYRSTDGGATWQRVSAGLPAGVAVAGMAADPSHQGTIYVATAKGVYSTANRGGSWVSQGPPTSIGSTSVVLAPGSTHLVLAGTAGDGIYASANGGATWASIGPSQATIQAVATDPFTGSTIYAGTDDGLLISTARGRWARAGLGHVSVQAIGVSAADPQTLYAGTDQGVLLSRDGGATWMRAGLRDLSVTTLVVGAQDAKSVYAASSNGGGLYRTTNGGKSWQRLAAGLSSANVFSLAFDPTDATIAYAGLDRGVFKSLQSGVSWASSSIYDRSVLSLVQPATAGAQYFAGTNGGVYASANGNVWTSAGLGNHQIGDVLTIVPTKPATATTLVVTSEAGIYTSADQGHNWDHTLLYPASAVAYDSTTNTVYAGTRRGLFQSPDRGRRWLFLGAGDGAFGALLVLPGHTLLAGGSAGLVWTSNAAAGFQRSSIGNGSVVQLLGLQGSGSRPLLIARTDNGQMFRSSDWKHWSDAGVGGQTTSAVTLGGDGNLYAATAHGIYRSSNAGISWILTDQQEATIQPLVLEAVRGTAKSALLEGLSGQGVIVRSPATTPVSPFAPLLNGSIGQYFEQTGHFVRAPFLDWYRSHQGEQIFGLPRTEARTENGQLVQYFDNALLVYHPEKADTPDVIQLAPLGLQAVGAPAARIASFDNTTTRRYFPQTGHSLSGEFLSFWRQYGGLDVFGLPIGEPISVNGALVQHFQNAWLQADQNAGAALFHTRLTPLGDQVLKQKGWLR